MRERMASTEDLFARATFKFEASVPEELSLEVGNILKIEKAIDDFWYLGKSLQSGLSGQFPKDFTQLIELPPTKENEKFLFALDDFYPEVNDDLPFKRGDIITLENKVDDSWGKGRCKNKRGIFPLNYTQLLLPGQLQLPKTFNQNNILYTAIVTMPVTAQLDNELTLVVGDVIAVTEIVDEVWAKGVIGNNAGIFPITFTEPLYKSSSKLNDSKTISASNYKSVCGNTGTQMVQNDKDPVKPTYTSGFHLKALDTISSFIEHNVNSLPKQSKNQFQNLNNEKSEVKTKNEVNLNSDQERLNEGNLNFDNKRLESIKDTVIAAYSYIARNKNELSFTKGDEIEIIVRNSEMWLYGKLRNNHGYVPRLYVSEHMYNAAEKYNVNNKNLSKNESTSGSDLKSSYSTRRISEDFKAVTDFDLTVRQGEIVTLLKELNEKWCEVKNNFGKTGFVPLTCIVDHPVGITKSQSSCELMQHAANNTSNEKSGIDTYKVSRNTLVNPKILSNFKSEGYAVSKFKANTNDSGFSSSESESRSSVHEGNTKTKQPSVRISRQQPISRFAKKPFSSIPPLHEKTLLINDNKTVAQSTEDVASAQTLNSNLLISNRKFSETKSYKKNDSLGRSKSLYNKRDARNAKNVNLLFNTNNGNQDNSEVAMGLHKTKNSKSDTISTCSSNSSQSTNHSTDSNRQTNRTRATQSSSNPDADLLFQIDLSEENPPVVPVRTSSNRRTALRSAPPPPSKAPAQSLPSPDRLLLKAPTRPPQPANIASKPIQTLRMTPIEHKLRIEKIRSEIEENCRIKKELENFYQNSFDGKERQEISENKQLVLAKLKRLQKELADLITDADHIYENLDNFLDPISTAETENLSTSSALPVVQPGPEEIQQQRRAKRGHVIQEILNTEADFYLNVEIIIEDIQKPLVEQLPVEMKTDILFGNLTEVRDFSASLLHNLKSTCTDQVPAEDWNIGKVFVDLVPRMTEVYKVYCCNHDDATALLEKYKDDQEFMDPVLECLSCVRNKTNTFDLGSFLIKPVQRILKYPLLLQQLLKLTDEPALGCNNVVFKDLYKAVADMSGVANIINEDKRRKDLVRKYRKGSKKGGEGRSARLTFHSVKKKSQRISLRIGQAAGLNQPETVDEKFNEVERRFKDIGNTIKSFIQNVNTFGTECHGSLCKELLLAEDFSDFYSSDTTRVMTSYNRTIRKVTDQLYRQFHDQVQMRVLSPLSSVLVKFKGPQALIDKRFDKLLDYETSQKNTDSKDKILMAKNVYTALNQQLVDELPRLCKLSLVLLHTSCAILLELFIKFQQKMLKEFTEIQEVLKTEEKLKENVELSKSGIIEAFSSLHITVLSEISHYNFIPSALSALSPSRRGTTSNKSARRSSFNRHEEHQQTQQQRENIFNKYSEYDLFVANESYISTNKMYVSCSKNNLIGIIKRQNPMGDNSIWFVDNGESTGFMPCGILCLYTTKNSYEEPTYTQINTPTFNYQVKPDTPSPKPRRQITPGVSRQSQNQPIMTSNQSPISSPNRPSMTSPNQSGTSPSQSSISRSPSAKMNTSPYSMRQSLYGRLGSPPQEFFGEEILDGVLDEEEEMMSEGGYEEVKRSHQKKCFRIEYDFEARSELELSVHCGEIVTLIIPHDLEGNIEWWLMAASNGLQGYVPANYMSPVEVEYL